MELCGSQNADSTNNFDTKISRIPHFNSLFVHCKHTPDMATCLVQLR